MYRGLKNSSVLCSKTLFETLLFDHEYLHDRPARIQNSCACPSLNFVSPSNPLPTSTLSCRSALRPNRHRIVCRATLRFALKLRHSKLFLIPQRHLAGLDRLAKTVRVLLPPGLALASLEAWMRSWSVRRLAAPKHLARNGSSRWVECHRPIKLAVKTFDCLIYDAAPL